MVNAKRSLTATSLLAIFGAGWLIVPDGMARYWKMAPNESLDYMGRRYGAALIGLGVAVWIARNALNTQARRALMIGALVALLPTTALSLYGVLTLELNAWSPFAIELVMTLGLAWVLFIRPDPVA